MLLDSIAQRYGVTPSSLAYQDIPSLNLDIFIFRKAIEKESAEMKKQQIFNKMRSGGQVATRPKKHTPKVRY